MKRRLTVVCALALLNLGAACGTTGLTLNVESGVKTVRVGDRVTVTLSITGAAVTNIVGATQGARLEDMGNGGFRYDCQFVAQEEGDCVFGPYTVSFNGQSLTSQPLTVHVLGKWSGTTGALFRIDRNRIALGEEVELVQETWSQKRLEYSASHARVKRAPDAYEWHMGPSSMSVSTSQGSTNFSDRQTWLFKPKNRGVFRITKDVFEVLPEGVPPPDLTVTVE